MGLQENIDVVISKSTILNAGLGVFALKKIMKGLFIGIYHGQLISSLKFYRRYPDSNPYAFSFRNVSGKEMILDGLRSKHWSRYMNCSTSNMNENVNVLEDSVKGQIIFEASCIVNPGDELLFYYGDDYAKFLDINYKSKCGIYKT